METVSVQNVGIGVPIPTQKPDVAGKLKIRGELMPGGVADTAGQNLATTGDSWNTAMGIRGRLIISW